MPNGMEALDSPEQTRGCSAAASSRHFLGTYQADTYKSLMTCIGRHNEWGGHSPPSPENTTLVKNECATPTFVLTDSGNSSTRIFNISIDDSSSRSSLQQIL
mmetsp:Transcript_15769/g.31775  ORF Transcript_15769/g.31775 Transcript_15769/m.31775 type:complete len:102 (-) Transcript_15769:448-753(-)